MAQGARRPLVEPRSHHSGRPPGVLPAHAPPARTAGVRAVFYDADGIDESDGLSPAEARALADGPGIAWIAVDGLTDTATVAAFGEAFGLHPLLVEDVLTSSQRPKLEVFDDAGGHPIVSVVARMVRETGDAANAVEAYCDADASTEGHRIDRVAFVLGPGWVLSFQEHRADVFEPVRERLRTGAGRVRRAGADYLLYALLDLVVDHVFGTLERIGDAAEVLEARALDDPEPRIQAALAILRRDLTGLRRAVWPLREVLAALQRDEMPYVEADTRPFLRDASDHVVQAVEVLESLREVLGSTSDLYLSSLGVRQNEVMKVLTVVGTLFLPLGFLTGVYGMNFAVMPELAVPWAYFALWAVMIAVAVATVAYFRRKGWI
ncbi:magnesium/cobalt transporter CorA [Rubrivirga sp. IMCC45206]|uniref:magnesium/cobalt transporter CorA n=1 Tax=Rubrivirga sp. IMCC45206 TaxID=3391614 RepID=UPI00398FA17C